MLASDEVVERIVDMVPELKTVTLHSVLPNESLDAGVSWLVNRLEADKELLLLVGAQIGTEHKLLQLLMQTQTVPPKLLNRIVDWNGATWFIRHISTAMGDRVFDCLLLKSVG